MTLRSALFAAAPIHLDLTRGVLPGYGPGWPLLANQPAGEGAPAGDGTTGAQGGAAATGGQPPGDGKEFVAPKDQAEFDRMIRDRIARERARYTDYDDLKAKAAEHDKTVEAQKTEAQKLTERATAAEGKATETEKRALRAEIALEKGLTPSQAKRLVGNTRDELGADADELLKDLGTTTGNGTGSRSTSFDSGTRTTAGTPKGAAGLEEARKRFPQKYTQKT